MYPKRKGPIKIGPFLYVLVFKAPVYRLFKNGKWDALDLGWMVS